MRWQPCFIPIEEFVELHLDAPEKLESGRGTLSRKGYEAFRSACASLFSSEDVLSRLPESVRVAYIDSAEQSSLAFVTPSGQMFVNRAWTKRLDQEKTDAVWSNELLHMLLDRLKTPEWDSVKVAECPHVTFAWGKEAEEFLSDTVAMHVNPEFIGLLVREGIAAPESLGDSRASIEQVLEAIGFQPEKHVGKSVRQVYEERMKTVDQEEVLRKRMEVSRKVVGFLRKKKMIENPGE